MKRTVTVSVFIPAYNEERNIKNIIQQVLDQKQKYWRLKEIIVICDGSSDKTYAEAISIKNRKLRVVQGKSNLGKVARVNQVVKLFKGDLLVQLDADITLKDDSVITNLVKEFRVNPEVKLVGGNSKVFPPKNFFQRSINTSYEVYYRSRARINNGHNVFGCTGAILAMKKDFARRIKLPKELIVEDTFIYFLNKKYGFKFRHAKDAVVYFKMAGNLKDFLRQVFRSHPESLKFMFDKYFGNAVREEYRRPKSFYLKNVMDVLVEQPVNTLTMIAIKLACIPFFPIFSAKYKGKWFTATSTK
ncbi:glycosyltransferase [Candidatus Woesebacteria bacterium]|nr:glycosyltransferase [Candidatus Woesebacteria bacterium]